MAITDYLIAHEAHHRGLVRIALNQCGIKAPESKKMGPWEWKNV